MLRVGVLLLLLLLVAPALADEEDGKPTVAPHPGTQEADAVLAAYEATDRDALKTLAKAVVPDPWIVADELCLRGAFDVAEVFARAAPRPDVARLTAYIATRRKRKPHVGVRAALRLSWAATTPARGRVAVEQMDAQRGNGDRFERAWLESLRGDYLRQLGRLSDAVDALMNAGALALEVGWLAQAAYDFAQAALVAQRARRFSAMMRAAEQSRRTQEARGSASGEAYALMLLGWAAAEMGDYNRALRFMRESVSLHEQHSKATQRIEAQLNLSLLHERRGEYSRALAVAEKALEGARRIKSRALIARALTMVGGPLRSLQDLEGALRSWEEARDLFEEEKDPASVADCLGEIAITLQQMHRFQEGYAQLHKASQIYKQLKRGDRYAVTMTIAGSIYLDTGDLERALRHLEPALKSARGLHDAHLEAQTLSYLAQVRARQGKYDEARALARDVIRVASKMAAAPLLLEAHQALAEIALRQKQYARAIDEAHRALEISRGMLVGLDLETGAGARDLLARIYATGAAAAAAWGRPTELFDFLESGRAGALLDTLAASEEIRDASIPTALRRAEEAARNEARIARVRYQRAYADGKVKPLRRAKVELDAAHDALQAIVDRVQREAKAAASVLYPEALRLEDFQAEMEAGEVLVLYGALPQEIVALVVTPVEARIVALGERASLEEAVTQLELDAPESKPQKAIDALAARLVKPLALPKETRRLLVSPAGALGYVPFALLTDVPEVACVPSGTAYRTFQPQAKLSGRDVLALGDPQYDTRAADGTARFPRLKLTPLPETRIEAKRVGDVLLLGERATEGGLQMALTSRERWRAVHLACHGLVNAERPMRSALAVTPARKDDGYLTYNDVFQLRVPADLAVLSACETGRGKIYRSEGIVGMTQAFMLAGAPRVICSLWKVDDTATRALMIKFYELWNPKDGKTGLGAAAALKKAQEYVRTYKDEDGKAIWEHPYYWAAWVLWGLPD